MHNSGNYVEHWRGEHLFFPCSRCRSEKGVPSMKCLRRKLSEHQASCRRRSGRSLGTRGKSFAAGKKPGEFKLAILAGALS
ncbi:MAG: hypothetical protein DMF36_02095 [Verrucomicrobia bacterium]|nr:MAG: hypothetical protein DMF36_02095 [Verrucomicrobiota bacterium]